MANQKRADPTETYVLEETAITRINSLEELAKLALGDVEVHSQHEAGGSRDSALETGHAKRRGR